MKFEDLTRNGIECRVTYLRPIRTTPGGFYTRHEVNLMGGSGRWFKPRGGETRAVITLPFTGKQFVGVAMCSPSDNFSRDKGRTLAVIRALQAAIEENTATLAEYMTNVEHDDECSIADMRAADTDERELFRQAEAMVGAVRTFVVDCNGLCTSRRVSPFCDKHWGRNG